MEYSYKMIILSDIKDINISLGKEFFSTIYNALIVYIIYVYDFEHNAKMTTDDFDRKFFNLVTTEKSIYFELCLLKHFISISILIC